LYRSLEHVGRAREDYVGMGDHGGRHLAAHDGVVMGERRMSFGSFHVSTNQHSIWATAVDGNNEVRLDVDDVEIARLDSAGFDSPGIALGSDETAWVWLGLSLRRVSLGAQRVAASRTLDAPIWTAISGAALIVVTELGVLALDTESLELLTEQRLSDIPASIRWDRGALEIGLSSGQRQRLSLDERLES
jgi:hypothetical protein